MEILILVILCLFVTNAALTVMLQRSNDRMADRMLALLDAEAARTAGVMRAKPAKADKVKESVPEVDVPPPPLWTSEHGKDFPQG